MMKKLFYVVLSTMLVIVCGLGGMKQNIDVVTDGCEHSMVNKLPLYLRNYSSRYCPCTILNVHNIRNILPNDITGSHKIIFFTDEFGEKMISGSNNGEIVEIDISTKNCSKRILYKGGERIEALALRDNKSELIVLDDAKPHGLYSWMVSAKCINRKNKKTDEIGKFELGSEPFQRTFLLHDEKVYYSGYNRNSQGNGIQCLNCKNNENFDIFIPEGEFHYYEIFSYAPHKLLFLGSGLLQIFDLEKKKVERKIELSGGGSFSNVIFSNGILFEGSHRSIETFNLEQKDLEKGTWTRLLEEKVQYCSIYLLTYDAEHQRMVYCFRDAGERKDVVKVFDLKNKQAIKIFSCDYLPLNYLGVYLEVSALTVAPDRRIVIGLSTGEIILADYDAQQKLLQDLK